MRKNTILSRIPNIKIDMTKKKGLAEIRVLFVYRKSRGGGQQIQSRLPSCAGTVIKLSFFAHGIPSAYVRDWA